MTTTSIKPEALKKVQAFVQQKIETASSQNEAAKQLGISGAHIINFRDGNWSKISEAQFRQIESMTLDGWGDYPTNNLNVAVGVIKAAQDFSRMVALVGYTGAGKTFALKKYAIGYKRAYYVLCDTEMSKRNFLSSVMKAVGVQIGKVGYNTGEMIDAICAKLNRQTHPVLLLDDAGKLRDSVMRLVQLIYDRTEGHCGILMAGTEYLKESIDKKARRNVLGFRELKRRINYTQIMPELDVTDMRTICKANGISDKGAFTLITQFVNDLGTLKNLIKNAQLAASKYKTAITRELIASITKDKEYYSGSY